MAKVKKQKRVRLKWTCGHGKGPRISIAKNELNGIVSDFNTYKTCVGAAHEKAKSLMQVLRALVNDKSLSMGTRTILTAIGQDAEKIQFTLETRDVMVDNHDALRKRVERDDDIPF